MAPHKYTPEQRIAAFWEKVDKSASDDGCWIWTGAGGRYGDFRVGGKNVPAHRISWEFAHGVIPDGLNVLHNCPDGDNPKCVNPKHLFLGTQKDNIQDMIRKGRGRSGRKKGSKGGRRNGKGIYPTGENHPMHKLTENAVQQIRQRFVQGSISKRQLAREFGVSEATIRDILAFKIWRD